MTGRDAQAYLCELEDRRVVEVSGDDAGKFLGDIVTGDVAGSKPGQPSYSGFLTPQGKVLFDFLLFAQDGRFLIDIHADAAADLIKRLSLYKLRARVEIGESGMRVAAVWGNTPSALPGFAADPRDARLGLRAILANGEAVDASAFTTADTATYHAHRIRCAVPEAPADFAAGEVFPHDIGMDQLSGVDFAKGCYIGQEVVSRMEHRGTARRRIVTVVGEDALPASGSAIRAGERELGTLGSRDGTAGIAIARLDRVAEAMRNGNDIKADGVTVTLGLPPWATYTWPADPA